MVQSSERPHQKPLSRNADHVEHEIEDRLKHGHSAPKTIHDEVYKLRKLDSRGGHLNHRAFHEDLAAIDKKLHEHGYLQHMHIVSHGHHAGQLIGQANGHHEKRYYDALGRQTPESAKTPKSAKVHDREPNTHNMPGRAEPDTSDRSAEPKRAPIRVASNDPTFGFAAEARAAIPQAAARNDVLAQAGNALIDPDSVVPQSWLRDRKAAGDTAPSVPRQRDNAAEVTPPRADQGQANYDQLRAAVQRAQAGGEPLRVLQYGDSHIADNHEARQIKQDLQAVAPTKYFTMARKGISADYPLRDPKSWLDNPINKTKPDLIVVSFGSNDADLKTSKESYKQIYENLVRSIKDRAPNASLLLLGPMDRHNVRGMGIDTVIEAQKEVATKYGADYFDVKAAMGGPGSIDQWFGKGLAEPDRWHLTPPNTPNTGDIVADHIREKIRSR